MEDVLVGMCEDMIKMLDDLRRNEKITEPEYRKHIKKKSEFISYVKEKYKQ